MIFTNKQNFKNYQNFTSFMCKSVNLWFKKKHRHGSLALVVNHSGRTIVNLHVPYFEVIPSHENEFEVNLQRKPKLESARQSDIIINYILATLKL